MKQQSIAHTSGFEHGDIVDSLGVCGGVWAHVMALELICLGKGKGAMDRASDLFWIKTK